MSSLTHLPASMLGTMVYCWQAHAPLNYDMTWPPTWHDMQQPMVDVRHRWRTESSVLFPGRNAMFMYPACWIHMPVTFQCFTSQVFRYAWYTNCTGLTNSFAIHENCTYLGTGRLHPGLSKGFSFCCFSSTTLCQYSTSTILLLHVDIRALLLYW